MLSELDKIISIMSVQYANLLDLDKAAAEDLDKARKLLKQARCLMAKVCGAEPDNA